MRQPIRKNLINVNHLINRMYAVSKKYLEMSFNWSTDIRSATWYITTVNRILSLFNVQQIHVNIDIHI